MVIVVPYASKEHFIEVSSYAQEKFYDMLSWADRNQIRTKLNPLICGVFVSLFSVMMVYYDSSIPGVNPPSPFSPKSKQTYHRQQQSSINLAYITAIVSGIVVSGILFSYS